jgi:hypothetical protein
MAIIIKPMITNLVLAVQRDIANAEITVDYDVNWSNFDQLTNLSYSEKWELVGDDNGVTATIFVGPSLVNGISSNGNATTHRTQTATIPFSDLDEDPNGLDEIAAVVTLTPKLPVPRVAKSALVTVDAP